MGREARGSYGGPCGRCSASYDRAEPTEARTSTSARSVAALSVDTASSSAPWRRRCGVRRGRRSSVACVGDYSRLFTQCLTCICHIYNINTLLFRLTNATQCMNQSVTGPSGPVR